MRIGNKIVKKTDLNTGDLVVTNTDEIYLIVKDYQTSATVYMAVLAETGEVEYKDFSLDGLRDILVVNEGTIVAIYRKEEIEINAI